MTNTMKSFKKTTATLAVAVSLATGGAVAIDQTQAAISLECDTTSAKVVNIDEKLRTYKIDTGFLSTREMSIQDRANIKGCEISKSVEAGKYSKDGESFIKSIDLPKKVVWGFINEASAQKTDTPTLEVEVTKTEPIDGGVQVFARVWSEGKQVGFGPDGTVDIERFTFINPPILVPDEKGDVVREYRRYQPDNTYATSTEYYREDPTQAILQWFFVNISRLENAHFASTKIVAGKVGNTTSTFYSAAAANSPIDGWVQRSVAGNTWTQTRDGTGTLTNNNGDFQFGQAEYCTVCGNRYIITRNVLLFDTSSIPDTDVISSADISVYSTGTGDSTNGDGSNFFSVTTAATNALANGDYNIANWGTTAFSTSKALSSIASTGYYTWSLNSSGISNISKTGISYFGERADKDAANTTPVSRGYMLMRSVDFTGTTNDPYLTVEHAAAATRRIINIQ